MTSSYCWMLLKSAAVRYAIHVRDIASRLSSDIGRERCARGVARRGGKHLLRDVWLHATCSVRAKCKKVQPKKCNVAEFRAVAGRPPGLFFERFSINRHNLMPFLCVHGM
jgi:hypothetical protein